MQSHSEVCSFRQTFECNFNGSSNATPVFHAHYYATALARAIATRVFSALWRAVVDQMCGSISRKLATNMYIVACVQESWHTTEQEYIILPRVSNANCHCRNTLGKVT